MASLVLPPQSTPVSDAPLVEPQSFGADWALPPLRDYAPGRHTIYPASTRLMARHPRVAAALAAALLSWAAMECVQAVLPVPRTALAVGIGAAVLTVLVARDALAGGPHRR